MTIAETTKTTATSTATSTATLTATVTLLSVKMVNAELPSSYMYGSRYGSRYVSHTYKARKLMLKFRLNGKLKIVYTPAVVISISDGFIISQRLATKNNWFKLSDGEVLGHKGAEMFDGHGLNIAIENTAKVIPAVSEGDNVTISYRINDYGKMIYIKKL